MAHTQQPSSGQLLLPLEGHKKWSTGAFGCCEDCKSTIWTLLCMPCNLCGMSSRMGEFACMPLLAGGSVLAMRSRFRTLTGIKGTICNDWLMFACCGACTVCQLDREMQAHGL